MRTFILSLLVIVALALLPFQVTGQQQAFTKVFYSTFTGTQAAAVMETSDHNFVVVGERNDLAVMIKAGQDGNIKWVKQVSDLGFSAITCIAPTHDSCFMMAGVVPDTSTGKNRISCIKMNAAGDTVFTRLIAPAEDTYVQSIQPTSDHGFILCGFSSLDVAPYHKIFLAKLTSAGNPEWYKTIVTGFTGNYGYSARQTSDGGYMLTGSVEEYSPYRLWTVMIKLTPSGNITWSKKAAGPLPTDYFTGWDSHETAAGYLFLIREEWGKLILMKTDLSGNFLWTKSYGAGGSGWGGFTANFPKPMLSATHDGGFTCVSSAGGYDDLFIRIDPAGNMVWARQLRLITSNVIETSDHGFLVVGNGPIMGVSMAPTDSPQIGIIKTDSLGYSPDCNMFGFPSADTSVVSVTDILFTVTAGAGLISSHPAITNTVLSIWDGCITVTGAIAENSNSGEVMTVSPNPSGGKFKVSVNQGSCRETCDLGIYNLTGTKLIKFTAKSGVDIPVDMSGYPEGVYLLRCSISGGVLNGKIIISGK